MHANKRRPIKEYRTSDIYREWDGKIRYATQLSNRASLRYGCLICEKKLHIDSRQLLLVASFSPLQISPAMHFCLFAVLTIIHQDGLWPLYFRISF